MANNWNFWTQLNKDSAQARAFEKIGNTSGAVAEANALPIVTVDTGGNMRKQALYDWSLYDQDFYS